MAEVLQNRSFEEGWTDLPPEGVLVNQQPKGWLTEWVPIGQFLYGSNDIAHGVPECVHKHKTQLPPDEQPGTPGALILDGEWVYKVFHAGAAFGARLVQKVDDLEPGSVVTALVPVLIDAHGSNDPWCAEVGIFINGTEGVWRNYGAIGQRSWHYIEVMAGVPSDGIVELEVLVKGKWDAPVDFFIDALSLDATTQGPDPEPPTTVTFDIPPNIEEIILRIQR